MNKKGFTLIELLGVVTLIVLISLIVIPNVLSSVNKKKSEIDEATMKLLSAATDTYIDNHGNLYASSFEADGSVYCIPIQSIIDDGILETPFKDSNGNEINYSDYIEATYSSAYNGFSYQKVSSSSCTEVVNYVSRPELSNDMIPVVYDNGSWKKADVNSKWYNYSDKRWANAVLVNERKSGSGSKSRFEYLESLPGTVINENDILAYFVWIPRFKYKLFSSNSPVSIDIIFEGINSPKSLGTQTNEWLTHPAFTYNNRELSGIWVGKYEASNSSNNIVIKSGLTPWTNIGFNDAFSMSNSMVSQDNIYGLKNFNGHLIQNNEWSAITYLTQSDYGLNDKINTNSATTTGGTNSTTGNVYGVYDMAGLSKEFVTITGETESSLGTALNETKLWYSDSNSFIDNSNSYLARGGSSIFNYNASNVKNNQTSFRPVLISNETMSSSQNTSLQYAYLNVTTNSNYSILQDAFAEAHDGDTIKLLMDFNDASTPVLDSGKSVKFDLAGNDLILNHILTNNGTLDIYSSVDGASITSSVNNVLTNNGTLTFNGTSSTHTLSVINNSTSRSSVYTIIANYGLATLNSGASFSYNTMSTTGTSGRYIVINYQSGKSIVDGASLTNKIDGTSKEYAISNASSATDSSMVINSGFFDTSGPAIVNNGSTKSTRDEPAILFNGGTIEASNGAAISNAVGGSMVCIHGGSLLGTRGIYNDSNGNIYITGTPTLTGTVYQAVRGYTGEIVIEGGTDSGPTLVGYTDGLYVSAVDDVFGSAKVTGHVSITGQTKFGIQSSIAGTTITLGEDDGTVSTTYPYIVSEDPSSSYGVYMNANATLNFYDGKIQGASGRALNRDPIGYPNGYSVQRSTVNGRQVAILGTS